MQLSIIVLTWNSENYIDACLESIVGSIHLSPNNYEIFIVDNGSTDRTRLHIEQFQQKHPNLITLIALDANLGTTYPRNLALKKATGQYLAIMDCDIEINSGTFKLLINELAQNNDAGLVAPRLVYGSGTLQKSTDQFPTLLHKVYRYLFLKQLESRENKADLNREPVPVDYAISAFWLFRRELIEQIGYLDEKFFYAPEDVDFCLRVWKHGQSVVYIPEAYAIHYAQEISRGLVFNKAQAEHLRGLMYYFAKHKYLVRKPKFTH
ncbi:MAG: glycosyltransferase family 2 protein [Pseudomonadota bacterium]